MRLGTVLLIGMLLYTAGARAMAATAQADDPQLTRALRAAANDQRSFKDPYDATVWLTDMSARLSKRIPDPKYRIKLLTLVHREAMRAGLRPALVLAVIQVESDFNQFAISRAGAVGLMQVMPFWLKKIGKKGDNLFRMKTNLRYGCTILKYYLDKEKGNLTEALGRYNGSAGRWRYPGKVFRSLDRRWYPN
jgi:soluble lytic murein transglycosylase-like protein